MVCSQCSCSFSHVVPSCSHTALYSPLYSEGCASAVKRILGKIDGVTDVHTDVASKKVVVQADPSVSQQLMLEKLQKVSHNVVLSLIHRENVHI